MTTYFPPKKNTAFVMYVSLVSQANTKIMQASATIAAGDFKVSIDGGALANLTTLPSVAPAASKMVLISLSTSEMNGDNITIICSDVAGAEWCDLVINLQTTARQIDDLAYPATSGRSMVVDASGLVDANAVKHGPSGSGTAQTARDIGASVLLSTGTGTGQLDFTSGVVKANLAQILGTALTETAGLIAAGFKKFFNVATPTGTINSIPDVVAGGAGGLFIAGTNAATTVTTALTTTFTGNLTGSVGSLTTNNDKTGYSLTTLESAVLQSGTAQAGASGTITLASGASAVDNLYVGEVIKLYGGTGAAQVRVITAYVGSTKVATVGRAWTTAPDNTSTYAVIALAVPKVNDSLEVVAASVTGAVGSIATGGIAAASFAAGAIDAAAIATDAIGSAEVSAAAVTKIQAGLSTYAGGDTSGTTTLLSRLTSTRAALLDFLTGDAFARLGAPVGASHAADIAAVQADTDDIQTRIPTALVSGRIDASVGAMAANTVTAAAVATNAIDADALATDAVNEIADGLLNRDMSTGTDSGSTTVRTVRQALRFLRNKWSISSTTLTVTKEDDSTASWTSTLTTSASADPITGSDPA